MVLAWLAHPLFCLLGTFLFFVVPALVLWHRSTRKAGNAQDLLRQLVSLLPLPVRQAHGGSGSTQPVESAIIESILPPPSSSSSSSFFFGARRLGDHDHGAVLQLRRVPAEAVGLLEALRQEDERWRLRLRLDGLAQVTERALLEGVAGEEEGEGEEEDWMGRRQRSSRSSRRQ
jgi:hypothetical protein